jgi:hypothetical protein
MKTGFVVDSHAENDCTVGDVAVMLASRNVTVIQTASDSHTVVVHCLANVEASVEIIPGLRCTTTELQNYDRSVWVTEMSGMVALTKQISSQSSAAQV